MVLQSFQCGHYIDCGYILELMRYIQIVGVKISALSNIYIYIVYTITANLDRRYSNYNGT